MANPKLRLPENIPGDFFVDATCIDCDTCRQLAPGSFRDHGGQASVYRQPATDREELLALMSLAACPTGSIGTTREHDTRRGIDAFPLPIDGEVRFCGFTAESSFGAWSYLIVRAESDGGNVMIDSPRYMPQLAEKIDRMGGIRTMLLTHQDDIADHAKYATRFGCIRIMHESDGAVRRGIERVIEGRERIELDRDLTIIPTPGHTRGHLMFLYRQKYLFTGDSLAWEPEEQTLTAYRDVCWYSWREQTDSLRRLLAHRFEWVLPGHGPIGHGSAGEMHMHLERCVEWMERIG
jgi:glyoxylase-like metal-dependent hydrolase (beta-lactamase superfamily II)/ferredoxin